MADGKCTFACNVREPDAAMHVLMKKFRRSALLPRRQASLRVPRCFLVYTILLDEMCSEDETELIEGKHRGSIIPPKERKNALSDLGHN